MTARRAARRPGKRASIGPKTVTVLGSHWPEKWAWAGLDFARAELREHSIWGKDYHLNVPFWHPNDGKPPDPPEMYYRVRLKRGWSRFVCVDGTWMVER